MAKKLPILADAAKYDASCASSGSHRKRAAGGLGNTEGMGICHSYTPDGRCVSLLKILLTNFCIYDCLFCINRISSDTPRARFTVEEVVKLTLDFYRRNYIEGLFLSSGIIRDSDYTMEQLVAVARSLRIDHKFGGYIHLKTIPNASDHLIAEAGLYADRLSINIELPTQQDLNVMAPAKQRSTIEQSMSGIKQNIDAASEKSHSGKTKRFAPAGQTTQMIVGATPSTDATILETSNVLYKTHRLRRVYYSAFSPIPHSAPGVPLDSTPLVREHRLYQADWLFRFYEFSHQELFSGARTNLNLYIDPKLQWALDHREFFPLNINQASQHALLRVPGLGVKTVNKIVRARKWGALKLSDLLRLRVSFEKVKYFLATADYNPDVKLLDSDRLLTKFGPKPEQLSFFNLLASPDKTIPDKTIQTNESFLETKLKIVAPPPSISSALSALTGEL